MALSTIERSMRDALHAAQADMVRRVEQMVAMPTGFGHTEAGGHRKAAKSGTARNSKQSPR